MKSLRARVLMLVAGAGLMTALVLAAVMHMSVRSYYTDVVYAQSQAFIDRVVEMHPDLWDLYERDPDAFSDKLAKRDFTALSDRPKLGNLLRMAHPSVDHYLPALTVAGASDASDDLTFMTDAIDLGSISMRSFVFHAR